MSIVFNKSYIEVPLILPSPHKSPSKKRRLRYGVREKKAIIGIVSV